MKYYFYKYPDLDKLEQTELQRQTKESINSAFILYNELIVWAEEFVYLFKNE